jgi:hypothetical protein
MTKALRMPTIKELERNLMNLKTDIQDDFSAYPADMPEDYLPNVPSMQVTIGWTPGAGYDVQTGDNSYTGPAYSHPHWAVVALFRRSNCRELAKDLINQLKDLYYQ